METLDTFVSILENLYDLLKFIVTHVISFIEFVLNLPNFIFKLINFIPEPLKGIASQFMIYVILIIVIMAVIKIRSSVKG